MKDLIQKMLKGDRIALSKLISKIENHEQNADIMKDIYPYTGNAYVIGITGAPGAGKSSLVNQIIRKMRSLNKSIGVIAIDPSSYFSGGAILGDRVRMSENYLDQGVFIRSMSTRGDLGGVASSTNDVIHVMDAFGFDVILVETVGVGQIELEIMNMSDTVALILTPNMGDAVQVMKAGIMEIAHIYVINKSDLDGADAMASDLQRFLHLSPKKVWKPKVIMTSTIEGDGISELIEAFEQRWNWLKETDHLNYIKTNQKSKNIRSILDQKWSRLIDRELELTNIQGNGFEIKDDPYKISEIIWRKVIK